MIEFGEAAIARGARVTGVVSRTPRVRAWAEAAGLPAAGEAGQLAVALRPDWVIAAGAHRSADRELLALARVGAVNFHDGPLPGYAGANPQVWALLAGETRFGVTWHRLEGERNTGEIVLRCDFDIAADETAASLTDKSRKAGLESLATLLDRIESGSLSGAPQDRAEVRYFKPAARPLGNGRIDFARGCDDVLRLVRALDFGGARNPVTSAKIEVGGRVVLVGAAAAAEGAENTAPGTVLAVTEADMVVATGSGPVRLSGLTDPDGTPVAANRLVAVGARLAPLDPDRAAALRQRAVAMAPWEAHWHRRLSRLKGANPGFVRRSGEAAAWADRRFPAPLGLPQDQLIAALAGWALFVAEDWQAGLAFAGAGIVAANEASPGYVAPWVPLMLDGADAPGSSLAELADALAPDFAAASAGGFASDLVARHPGLAKVETPAIGISASGPVPGTAFTLAVADDVVTFWHDANALDVGAHCRLAGLLGRFLEALEVEGAGAEPLGALIAGAASAPQLSVAAWTGLWAEDIPGAGPRPFAAPAFDRSAIMLRRREMRAQVRTAAE